VKSCLARPDVRGEVMLHMAVPAEPSRNRMNHPIIRSPERVPVALPALPDTGAEHLQRLFGDRLGTLPQPVECKCLLIWEGLGVSDPRD
jgi:hypothetical protein